VPGFPYLRNTHKHVPVIGRLWVYGRCTGVCGCMGAMDLGSRTCTTHINMYRL
jgi:hypothetical protein